MSYLHRALAVPEKKNLPVPLLSKIAHAAPGRVIKLGKKNKIVVTKQLKARANFVLMMKRL